VRWFSTLVAKNTNFDDAKLVVPAADLDSWTFQARDEGPDEGTKQQNRSEIGLDGVQKRRKVDPRQPVHAAQAKNSIFMRFLQFLAASRAEAPALRGPRPTPGSLEAFSGGANAPSFARNGAGGAA